MEAPGVLVNAALDYAVTRVNIFGIKKIIFSRIHFRVVMVKVFYLFGHRVMVEYLEMIAVLMVMSHIIM
jgi:hypothetical protein